MADSNEMVARPIGQVVSGRPWPPGDDNWEGRASEIEIGPDWAPALEGIEEFSHIWLVWWFNRHPDPPESTHVHPEGRADMPRVGLFASRSPRRPNPIAMTVVRLLERNGDRLKVEGLDACQGTPILDIKPYLRRGDLVPEATSPDWLQRLWRIHDEED